MTVVAFLVVWLLSGFAVAQFFKINPPDYDE